MKVFGIVGWKNSGKTTLMERLVAEISGRGFTVSTVKHAHHSFDIDQKGKDSYRHREAGAREVVLASSRRWVLMHELQAEPEPGLNFLLDRMQPADLVLVEGFKTEWHPKIEAHRKETGQPAISGGGDQTIRAVATDYPAETQELPVYDLNDIAGIADFILGEVGLV